MKKIFLILFAFIAVISSFFIIFASCKMNRIIVVGGSTACIYEDDNQHILKKSGWFDSFSSYIGDEYNIENFTKSEQSLSDVINNKVFKKSLETLGKDDILLLQIEEVDYTKENLMFNLDSLIDMANNKAYKLIIILPFHFEGNYISELKSPIYEDDDILKLNMGSNGKVIAANFNRGFEEDRERFKFVLSIYKDKNKGYDYEAFNYVFADSYAKALVDYIKIGEFNINKSEYKITRGMYISQLLKFANQDLIKGNCFLDVEEDNEFYDAIATAKELGIVSGDGFNFYPDKEITIGDACVIATNLLKQRNYKVPEIIKEIFKDYNEEVYNKNLEIYAKNMNVEPYAAESTFAMINKVYMDDFSQDNTRNFTILDIYRFVYDELY